MSVVVDEKDGDFLERILTETRAGRRVSWEDVVRLRRLADWADAPMPEGWGGTLDKNEAASAVGRAHELMGRAPR